MPDFTTPFAKLGDLLMRVSDPLFVGISLLFLLLGLTNSYAAESLPASISEKIDDIVSRELKTSAIPALQVAIGHKDAIIYDKALGFADLEHQTPATTSTKFRTASISKWLTATAVMQLYERKALKLDVPVQSYCPTFPEKKWPVTTRQLLRHTGGIRHYIDYPKKLSLATSEKERQALKRLQLRDLLGKTASYTDDVTPLSNFKDDPLLFQPDTEFYYSSHGYRILGCVIKGASGKPYRDYLQEHILAPAGMVTTVPDNSWQIIPHRARGYRVNHDDDLQNARFRDVSENLPGGGHLSTAHDLAKFAMSYIDEKFISRETIATMTERPPINTSQDMRGGYYALGLAVLDQNGYKVFSHAGGQNGVATLLVAIPDLEISIAVMANLEKWSGHQELVIDILTALTEN